MAGERIPDGFAALFVPMPDDDGHLESSHSCIYGDADPCLCCAIKTALGVPEDGDTPYLALDLAAAIAEGIPLADQTRGFGRHAAYVDELAAAMTR